MTSESWFALLVALVSSGTVGTVISWVGKFFARKDPQRIAMRLLLQDKLTDLCRKALEAEDHRISYSNYHLINQMYLSYKALGGNGDMKHLMDAVDKLVVYIDNPDK